MKFVNFLIIIFVPLLMTQTLYGWNPIKDIKNGIRNGAKWAGDRTGLRRPIEEVTGVANARRTAEARKTVEALEAQLMTLKTELSNERKNLSGELTQLNKEKKSLKKIQSEFRQIFKSVEALNKGAVESLSQAIKANRSMRKRHSQFAHQSDSVLGKLKEMWGFAQDIDSNSIINTQSTAILRLWIHTLENYDPPSEDNVEFYNKLEFMQNLYRANKSSLIESFAEGQITLGQALGSPFSKNYKKSNKSITRQIDEIHSQIIKDLDGVSLKDASSTSVEVKRIMGSFNEVIEIFPKTIKGSLLVNGPLITSGPLKKLVP